MKKNSIVKAFEKKWDDKNKTWVYKERSCPYCNGTGRLRIYGEVYECAACDRTGNLFRDGNPDVNEKLLAAAPSVYMDHVRKWTLSIAKA